MNFWMNPSAPDLSATLWENLPVAAVVLGADGLIHQANERTYEFSGYEAGKLVGRSLFDLIVPEDLVAILDSMGTPNSFEDIVLGPFSVRYMDAFGTRHWCSAWAIDAQPEIGIEGWVVTLSGESCGDHLSKVLRGIAADTALEESLAATATAVGAFPTRADAFFILDGHADDDPRLCGSFPFDDAALLDDPSAPWKRSSAEIDDDICVDELPEPIQSAAHERGYRRVWLHSLTVDERHRGVLVAWRRMDAERSPNQRRNIDDCLAVAGLAISRHDHRLNLRRAAYSDHLTGLGNRALLELRSSDPATETSGVMYIDVDDFKDVNDRYGHPVGDAVLGHISNRLLSTVADDGEAFRIGGDEFVVVCASSLPPTAIEDLARRLVDAIAEPVEIDGVRLVTSVSVGVASDAGPHSIGAMTERADRALIRAKRSGKGRWAGENQTTDTTQDQSTASPQ